MKHLLKSIKPKITTNNLNSIALQQCEKYNIKPAFLNYKGFPGAICASVNNVLVHGIPNDTPLKKGDIITIDFGAIKDGFIGDTAETICIEDKNKIIETCRNALKNGISMAKPNNKLSDISTAIFNSCGNYSTPLIYGGHGIDRNKLHSEPFIPNYPIYEDDFHLRPGMILAIEPMLIDSKNNSTKTNGWNVIANGVTAHCEHTILITKGEPYILTEV